ncbi:phytepsin-like isoform X1 [Iris pallida]|uniref:Phytepsin-like isoform X1 n=1 Tax=Iris pallida TaxID=29817 RepID=A0AAX6FCJ1_IRIPA|nr:phytepsin-like isoform X1 [Iris pallida]
MFACLYLSSKIYKILDRGSSKRRTAKTLLNKLTKSNMGNLQKYIMEQDLLLVSSAKIMLNLGKWLLRNRIILKQLRSPTLPSWWQNSMAYLD